MTISRDLLDELLKGSERPEDLFGDAGGTAHQHQDRRQVAQAGDETGLKEPHSIVLIKA